MPVGQDDALIACYAQPSAFNHQMESPGSGTQTPHAMDLHCRDRWGRLAAGGSFPAKPSVLATDGCPGRVDRTAPRHPLHTPGVVAVGFKGQGRHASKRVR